MTLWHHTPDLEQINRSHDNTAVSQLGIEFTEVGDDHLTARMPVDARTKQPAGLLHGGATMLLSETMASCAAWQTIDRNAMIAVGVEINANHVRGVRAGWVTGRVTAIHLGRSTQVWEVRVTDEDERLVSIARATLSVIALKPA
jgi:1,4-dihydroxy-2-naphthoyl-CoA hydrolase